jgi:hypothetical protein
LVDKSSLFNVVFEAQSQAYQQGKHYKISGEKDLTSLRQVWSPVAG